MAIAITVTGLEAWDPEPPGVPRPKNCAFTGGVLNFQSPNAPKSAKTLNPAATTIRISHAVGPGCIGKGIRSTEGTSGAVKATHNPDEFFTQEVIANGDHIQILVNGKKTVDWKDPYKTYTKGHFALQGHDPGSTVYYKNIRIKPLP